MGSIVSALALSAMLLLVGCLVVLAFIVGLVRWFFAFLDSGWRCPPRHLQLHQGEDALPVGGCVEGHR